jgi:uncharacterized repeat protein (TIGR03803 family)
MRKLALILFVLTLVLTTAAWADTESVIYSFGSLTGATDGEYPNCHLIADKSGNLYGTTYNGGNSSSLGVVFELKPGSGGSWTESVLYTFTGGTTDGQNPATSLVMDASGNLYGMTRYGGASNQGTVFELTNAGKGKWTETIIHSFSGYPKDGAQPYFNELSFDSSGNLYGTTQSGGLHNYGTVFVMASSKGKWSFKTIHNFAASTDGANPYGALTVGADGYFYGATLSGGVYYNDGTVYELFESRGVWTGKVIYYFSGGYPGENPYAGLVLVNGSLYGSTRQGGTDNLGTVFKLAPGKTGGTWTQSIVYNFTGGSSDGEYPYYGDSLIADSSGNLYGMTYQGGISDAGTVYELVNNKGSYTEKVLYSFVGGDDGANPLGSLVMVKTNLYGTTPNGGAHGVGTTFEIKP